MKLKLLVILINCLLLNNYLFAITSNPIISRGKPAYSSAGGASYLVDNKFGGTAFAVSNNSWIALNVGSGHSKVFVNWNSPSYSWSDVIAAANSCKNSITLPVNYIIQTSSNSTNGNDGQWTTATTVTDNTVTARGHGIDFTGAAWIKMFISNGGGSIDELEVFDIFNNSTDLWFFPGTSITANTYKGTVPSQDYADLITQAHPGYTPMMVRGGIPCITSGSLATDLEKYLSMAGNVKYWAIEMGTNDAWGGTNSGVANYKKNMQTVITACKTAGIQPILSRMISTNQSVAGWQVHPDYLKAIDDLTTQNNLIAGPDLYTYFLSHTGEYTSEGVHPNATGAASIQRLWAQKMSPLYSDASKDCNNTAGGLATLDACGVCIGGETGRQPCKDLPEGSYSVKAVHSGLCLSADNPIDQQSCIASNFQIWLVSKTGNLYELKNAGAQQYLNYAQTALSTDLTQTTTHTNTQWRLEDGGNGAYTLVPASNYEVVANVSGASLAPGIALQLNTRTGNANQKFMFSPADIVTGFDNTYQPTITAVYPNPFSEFTTIQMANDFTFVISDVLGNIVSKGKARNYGIIGSTLGPGMYLLQVSTESKSQSIKIFKK